MKNYLLISPYIKLADAFLENINKDDEIIIKFDMEVSSFDQVGQEANNRTLFNDKKIIVLQNYDQTNDEPLLNYLGNYPPDVSLVIWVSKKLDERKKSTKQIKELLEVVDYSLLKEEQIINLTKKYLEHNNKKIDYPSLQLLGRRCLSNYDLIINEVDKLIVNCPEEIILKDVQEYVCEYIEDNIFKIKDTIISKNMNKALSEFDQFLINKSDAMALISLLAKEYRLLYIVKNNTHDDDYTLSQKMKIHSYPIKLAKDKMYKYTNEELKNNLLYLANLDISIKSGKLDKNEGFRQFIIYSCEI